MQITVAEISSLLQGEVYGDANAILNKVAKIEEGEPGALSFLANPKYEHFIYETQSTAVLVNKTFVPNAPVKTTLIKVEDAYASFTYLLEQFSKVSLLKNGISEQAFIDSNATLAPDVYIGHGAVVEAGASIGSGSKVFPQVYIGDRAKVGKNCVLFPGVKIYNDCIIGDNCIIHSGTVIGSDGFGFAPLADRSYKKIPQIGIVVIEDDVEIGANTTIDRATMGSTIIRKGAKLDNLVQIAHNVEIGEHTVIASQSGVAGSTKIGKYCVIGGQVGFAGHITIADGSQFGAQSGINVNIKTENGKWFGSPILDLKSALRTTVVMQRLPELEKRVQDLEKLLKQQSQ